MRELPVPEFYRPERVGEVWRVPYEDRAREARSWAEQHGIPPSSEDGFRVCLLAVDVQNTFCVPGFELFVGGRSGRGAVDDNRRLCEFVYRNLGTITQIVPSLDTHRAMQVFHSVWLVDDEGRHPEPYTLVSAEDVEKLAGKNVALVERLLDFDAVIVAGQAKSHCVAWTIDDLLEGDGEVGRLAERTYLLEDCSSPVVVPGVVDYTDEADAAFRRFAQAGMHVVRSTEPIEGWPGIGERLAEAVS